MTPQEKYEVIVIGSGPAGLSAACSSAGLGRRTLILERLENPSVKLLASGGGRCNFANVLDDRAFMDSFGRDGRFMSECLRAFPLEQLLEFLRSRGVKSELTDGFHYFPASGAASDVRDAFLGAARANGAVLRTGVRVTRIVTDGGAVSGVETSSGETIAAPKIILACGGTAMPGLGGSRAGLELAAALGHTVVKPLPAMAPLCIRESYLASLPGLSLPDARLFFTAGRRRFEARGELLFTHDGFSGPAAIDLSADAARVFDREGKLAFFFAPAAEMDRGKWRVLLTGFRRDEPKKFLRSSLAARFFPHALADALAAHENSAECRNAALTNPAIEAWAGYLSAIPVSLARLAPMERAMAMAGGVSLKEVDPKTLASRLVRNLYFAGEMLDLAGPCGGYNIRFALASGRLAGQTF